MRSKKWVSWFLGLALLSMTAIGGMVGTLDPYFHYHKPLPGFFYRIYNQRAQNNGIIRHFPYNGMITGTSMTENFMASDAEQLFGGRCIKVPNEGGYFKEIDENIALALQTQKDLRYVIRGLDLSFFNVNKDARRTDMGVYPDYLYDDNYFNDVYYLLNKKIILKDCKTLLNGWAQGRKEGYTDFDYYSNWTSRYEFGPEEVLESAAKFKVPSQKNRLKKADRIKIQENIRQNITALPEKYPEVEFYYFIPPYSAAYWGSEWSKGNLDLRLETEALAIGEILASAPDNLQLYAFDDVTKVTGNLQLYTDTMHYSEAVNSWILEQMKLGAHRLTEDNYEDYMSRVAEYYHAFAFNELFKQLEP